MSKELAFTDDNDVVKYLDTTTAFNLALTADGVAFDLTNAKSILVKIANDDGYIMQQTIDSTTVTSPLGGTLSFPINQNIMNTLVPDDYDIEVWVTMNDGTQAIFPSDGTLGFSIEENLMSDTGEVIPTITLNDFQQQFNDLSSQMENAVHNVHKGDQGNPGNGIKSANNQYQLSDSPVTVPTGGWSDTILATTDQLPYLWTKIIFIYDDGTTNEINFVSSRGDTGSQGPMGPVGPQGKQGNGLVVRGKADKEENLPTTGNNQGDGYLVGTDLYIWIDGSWQNMGSITPDLADYVKVADMNNALSTKANTEDVNQQLDKKVNVSDEQMQVIPNGTDLFSLFNTQHRIIHYIAPTGDQAKTMVNVPVPSAFVLDTIPISSSYPNWNYTLLRFRSLADNKTYYSWINTDDKGTPSNVGWSPNILDNKDGTITLNGKTITPAEDSKVAHLSGANNFDTVPTVNNNPLLLASSLPSDLARTGQDTNFTRKLQKSGIDVATTADVSKAVNTATSNVVTTDKPANFTAGLQSGGVSVATSDDLKSVEANAWRVLDQKNLNLGGTLLYKIDQSSKKIYMLCSIECNSSLVNKSIADFSSVVKNITTISGKAYAEFLGSGSVFASISNLSIYDPTSIVVDNLFMNGSANVNFSAGAYFTYDSLR